MPEGFDRRQFLKFAVTGAILPSVAARAQSATTAPAIMQSAATDAASPGSILTAESLSTLAPNVTRHWLGPHFWGNRLQDWRLADGRIECDSDEKGPDLRTVSILTRQVRPDGTADGTLSATLGRRSPQGKGFGGFLLGAGSGELDYRAAALVQRASGQGGGILCVVDTDGNCGFREHTDEQNPLAYKKLTSEDKRESTAYANDPVELSLKVTPSGADYRLELTATVNGQKLSSAILSGVKAKDITGGAMLVSAATSGPDGARYWFQTIKAEGDAFPFHADRALGPVLGTLYSLNGNVLKLTAQFMPQAPGNTKTAALQTSALGGKSWVTRATAPLSDGWVASFRLTDWDRTADTEYRIAYSDDGLGGDAPVYYTGTINRDPVHRGDQKLRVGLYSCVAATARALDGGRPGKDVPKANPLGRYTLDNMYFPYPGIIGAALEVKPDLLVFCGDQFYETNPTVKVKDPAPLLDYLYKYYLWLWAHQQITRNTPSIVLVDDHDMYHGNLWGNAGRHAPDENQDLGGYVRDAKWVNMVQATQCGHNPDPFDPTPVQQGITVYYGAFKYGGVDFCVLEDRKWKTCPVQGTSLDVHVAQLLGRRQEKFLQEWGRQVKDSPARICITATLLGTLQTSPEGEAVVDFDSNGYPPLARDRAVDLLREANVLILSGDQHLGSVVRLGNNGYTDGPVQFCGPAGGTLWTRWFEPAGALPNAGATPYTGDFRDGFGNKMRVLAVANPAISFAEFRKHRKGRGQGIGDRALKSEGYGIVDVDLQAGTYTLNCWRYDVNPAASGAKQYAGWPIQVPIKEAGSLPS